MRVFVMPPQGPGGEATLPVILRALEAAGHERVNDPMAGATFPGLARQERDAFVGTLDALMGADLLVADVTDASLATGWCLAWFLAKGRMAVLACLKTQRSRLHPLVAGNPSPWQRLLVHEDAEDLGKKLTDVLRTR